jgi:predicted DNA-binding protein
VTDKPRLIQWLEETTGETLERVDLNAPKSRHVSIRIPEDLHARLEALAKANGQNVSRCARRILEAGVTSGEGPTAAIDDAIATLQRVRAELEDEDEDEDET